VAVAATVAALAVIAFAWQAASEYRTMTQVERLVGKAYDQDWVEAYEAAREAARFLRRPNYVLPLLGFRHRQALLAAEVNAIPLRLSVWQYNRFNAYAAQARGGAPQTSLMQALSIYDVLKHPDWQRLPQFQALDPLRQAQIEEDVTEMLLLRALERVQSSALLSATGEESLRTGELLSRIPLSQRKRFAVVQVGRLSGDQPTESKVSPTVPRKEWERFDLYLMGVVAAKRGEFERAIGYFDAALENPSEESTHSRFWTYFHRAYCAEQIGNVDLAVADYGACIGLNNRVVAPHHNLGLIYAGQQKFEMAAKYLREAVKYDGRSLSSHVNLAAAELKLGNFSAALDAANDAVRIDDSSAEAYANRGAVRAAMGHREAARADLRRALEIDPSCAAARQNLELLDLGSAASP
jgi:tetratricopeptide (TPR) repeat protein